MTGSFTKCLNLSHEKAKHKKRNVMKAKNFISTHAEPIFYGLVFLASSWCSVTTAIMAFKNPEMTQTQLFLAIPRAFVLRFD